MKRNDIIKLGAVVVTGMAGVIASIRYKNSSDINKYNRCSVEYFELRDKLSRFRQMINRGEGLNSDTISDRRCANIEMQFEEMDKELFGEGSVIISTEIINYSKWLKETNKDLDRFIEEFVNRSYRTY